MEWDENRLTGGKPFLRHFLEWNVNGHMEYYHIYRCWMILNINRFYVGTAKAVVVYEILDPPMFILCRIQIQIRFLRNNQVNIFAKI